MQHPHPRRGALGSLFWCSFDSLAMMFPMHTLIIIAKKGFQDVELAGVRSALLAANATITLASTETGSCIGKFSSTEQAEISLRNVQIDDYDRIVFIGGPGAQALSDDSDAQCIAVQTVKAGKVLGAICIAPLILAKAGVLAGKQATVWDENGAQKAILEANGAKYTGQSVTIDGKIITGNGPDAAEEFGRMFVGL